MALNFFFKHMWPWSRQLKSLPFTPLVGVFTVFSLLHSLQLIYEWALFDLLPKRCLKPYMWSEVKLLSRVQLFVPPWTVAHQAPQPMEFSRQEYWSGLPFPSPGHLPNLTYGSSNRHFLFLTLVRNTLTCAPAFMLTHCRLFLAGQLLLFI